MSQRLHIGSTEKTFYDCVLTSIDGALEAMDRDWIMHRGKFMVGPWKVRIGDLELYRKLESQIEKLFCMVGECYPNCVWAFYKDDGVINHPSRAELEKWLA